MLLFTKPLWSKYFSISVAEKTHHTTTADSYALKGQTLDSSSKQCQTEGMANTRCLVITTDVLLVVTVTPCSIWYQGHYSTLWPSHMNLFFHLHLLTPLTRHHGNWKDWKDFLLNDALVDKDKSLKKTLDVELDAVQRLKQIFYYEYFTSIWDKKDLTYLFSKTRAQRHILLDGIRARKRPRDLIRCASNMNYFNA